MTAPTRPARPTVSERWLAFRNARLSDPHFQRWAATFPLTRMIAARRAKGLFDLCAGFVYSQALLACVRLKLFETLRDGPLTFEEISTRLGLPEASLTSLLTAAQALRLVEREGDGRYTLGSHGAAYLGNPSLGVMIEHHALLYRDLEDPVALLRGEKTDTALSAFWPYASSANPGAASAESVAPYSAIMAETQALIADDVLDAYPMSGHRRLLDIGGGEGAFLARVADRYPDLDITLFDLPAVVERARSCVLTAGKARATFVGGDFKRDVLPAGSDVVSLVRILHDQDDGAAESLLTKAFEALSPGGILLVAEPLAQTAGAETVGAYFAFYLLAMRRGRPRSASEVTALLYRAGFARVREVATARPLLTSLLVAQKSAGPANRYVNPS